MNHSPARALVRAVVITSLALRASRGQAPSSAPDSVHVLVSRREVRLVFPRDTARSWGWSARNDPSYFPRYIWGISIAGMDGPRSLSARIEGNREEARAFPSLKRLVAAARAELCLPGMLAQCDSAGARAAVENDQVVITFDDSARIGRIFGMRPALVSVWQERPDNENRLVQDSARVEYVAPHIPAPDAATRADAARSQRRYLASITTITRYITGGTEWHPLWLEAGDSALVSVSEMICHHDVCRGRSSTPLDSGWTIADQSIARLEPVKPDSSAGFIILSDGGKEEYVKALRPGRTTLRVRGIHSASDTAASRTPPARQLERQVIVTPAIARIEITPRPDTVRLKEALTFRVRALDHRGREVIALPWQLEVLDGPSRGIYTGPQPQSIVLTPGRFRIAAKLGAHTDTVTVTVLPTRPAPPRRP